MHLLQLSLKILIGVDLSTALVQKDSLGDFLRTNSNVSGSSLELRVSVSGKLLSDASASLRNTR